MEEAGEFAEANGGLVNIARHDQQCTTSRYELLL